jgi:ABC-2 type transport system permease protein
LCFGFLFVFPKIGQGIGGLGANAQSAFATVLVPGVVGISVMFQGVQSIALAMATEFGFTREIEDRVQAPCPIWLVAIAKVLSGAAQGVISAVIVLPIASVVHAAGVHAHLHLHWVIIVTLVPLASIAMAGLGLVLGTSFEPRNIGLMFGFIILPVTFLGCTYYPWTRLAPVKVGGFHWLQTVVLVNPLVYAPVCHLPRHDRVCRGVPCPGLAELPPASVVLSEDRDLAGRTEPVEEHGEEALALGFGESRTCAHRAEDLHEV